MNISIDKTTLIFLVILIGGGLIVGTVALVGSFGAQKTNAIVRYAPRDAEKPKAVITTTDADLGLMKVTEEKTASFTVKNEGSRPLQLFNPQTSCMCTFLTITIDGATSPEWTMSMHNPPSAKEWIGPVAPGSTATIRGIYRPALMPVIGPIERKILVDTNDPEKPTIELTVRATVQ